MVIEECRCSPRPANRHAHVLSLALLMPAVLLFAVSFAMPAYGGIAQLLSLIMIVCALFVAYKFVFSFYTYTITDPGDGIPCLLVEQMQGKRSSLVCRLPLYAVMRVFSAEEESARGKAYVYVATMHGGCYQYVSGRMDDTNILLKLEADEAFMAALTSGVAEARSRRNEE